MLCRALFIWNDLDIPHMLIICQPSSSGFYVARENNRGRYTDSPAGRPPAN